MLRNTTSTVMLMPAKAKAASDDEKKLLTIAVQFDRKKPAQRTRAEEDHDTSVKSFAGNMATEHKK
jgi:hypothetical protein